jgi:hypothetical protein
MNSREWYQLNKVVTATAKTISDSEKFLVGVLSVRARKLAEAYPTDQTAVGLYNFLNRKAQVGTVFITRGELRQMYDKLYTQNNKFAEAFSKELGKMEKAASQKMFSRDESEGADFVKESYEKLGNPLLVRELESAFDKNKRYQPFTSQMSKNAQKVCASELNCCGALPKNIEVVAGEMDVLICSASYETPLGKCNVLIPVEIKESKALIPTMFLTVGGFAEISKNNIEDHIKATAGKKFEVNVQDMLGAILKAKHGAPKPMSDVERIVMMASATKESPVESPNAILRQAVDNPTPDVSLPEFEQDPEVNEFARALGSSAGAAEFVFGKEAVANGRSLVEFALKNAGYEGQVAVFDSDDDKVVYAVSVDNSKGFTVPVMMNNKVPQAPTVAIANGGVHDLSATGISGILGGKSDQKVVAVASPVYGLKPSELINRIRECVASNRYEEAEDALNVLQQSGDDKAFKAGYAEYFNGLKGVTKTASTAKKTSCSAPVQHKHSKHVVCSHTGLPLHEVYQDEHGDCHPMYRKSMKETSEGASFLHSRIYFE